MSLLAGGIAGVVGLGPVSVPAVAGAEPTAPNVATAAIAHPRAPHEPAAIEAFAPEQAQFFCRHSVEPGVRAFETLVLRTYPATHSDGDMRGCDVSGSSEHKDGRAWDWGADHRVRAQRKDGNELLHWLFATDARGNPDAMFRRLGLMYVIWNKRIWGSWGQHWEPYSCSGVTLCHVDHMHFSFGWAGAERKSSFWTRNVHGVVEPPLPRLTTRGAHRSLSVSAVAGSGTAHWLVAGGDRYRLTARGTWHARSTVADAVCTRTARGWRPSAAGATQLGGDQIAGAASSWTPGHDNGHGCDVHHVYRSTLDAPRTSTVTVTVPGAGAGSGAGAVRVRATRTG